MFSNNLVALTNCQGLSSANLLAKYINVSWPSAPASALTCGSTGPRPSPGWSSFMQPWSCSDVNLIFEHRSVLCLKCSSSSVCFSSSDSLRTQSRGQRQSDLFWKFSFSHSLPVENKKTTTIQATPTSTECVELETHSCSSSTCRK